MAGKFHAINAGTFAHTIWEARTRCGKRKQENESGVMLYERCSRGEDEIAISRCGFGKDRCNAERSNPNAGILESAWQSCISFGLSVQ